VPVPGQPSMTRTTRRRPVVTRRPGDVLVIRP